MGIQILAEAFNEYATLKLEFNSYIRNRYSRNCRGIAVNASSG